MWDTAKAVHKGTFIALNAYIKNKKGIKSVTYVSTLNIFKKQEKRDFWFLVQHEEAGSLHSVLKTSKKQIKLKKEQFLDPWTKITNNIKEKEISLQVPQTLKW